MAVYTTPGVYIEEIPSGVRTITGVSTSTTAFVGRTYMGPVDRPVQINSFGEFTNIFGGLWGRSPLSFSVQHFFANGGQIAVIVRVVPSNETVAKFSVPGKDDEKLEIVAANPGTWANSLAITVDYASDDPASRFNLTVQNLATGASEVHRNLSADRADPHYLKPILARQSALVRVIANDNEVKPPLPTGQTIEFSGTPDGGTYFLTLPWLTGDKITTEAINFNADVDAIRTGLEDLTGLEPGDIEVVVGPEPASFIVNFGEKFRGMVLPLMGVSSSLTPVTASVSVSANAVTSKSPNSQEATEGSDLNEADVVPPSGPFGKKGMYLLEDQDIFNLLVIPPLSFERKVTAWIWNDAASYCRARRAFLLVDPPPGSITAPANATSAGLEEVTAALQPATPQAQYAGYFFPRFTGLNQLTGLSQEFAPSGAIAGIMARTDAIRGVWKAPAGIEAGISGALSLSYPLTDGEIGTLNQLGANCLRTINLIGSVVWGARTLAGSDRLASEWKYIPVRRLALFIEESLYRGTQWVVFEPNDEPLWSQIRLNLGAFMHDLFRQGAFQGTNPRDAYFVKCDSETTTQNDINAGVLNILVGFAPLKPAEFVVIQIQQMAGQVQA